MKRIFIWMVVAVLAIASNATRVYAGISGISVRTQIFDGNSQPPIVGGIIDNYTANEIQKKGIIVSANSSDVDYKGSEYMYDPSCYAGDWKSVDANLSPLGTKDYRMIDCSAIGADQFWCSLKLLKSATDYYVRAFVVKTDGTTVLGNVEKVHTQSYSRYSGKSDYANVWYAFSNTLFDLVTDEIINPNNGFYYSTNENPTNVRFQKGTSYNTCYKFATEWNYKLWYYHNANHCNKSKIINLPIMTYSNGKLTIEKNPLDADKSITLYYSIDGDYFRPENYTDIYQQPLSISSPCTVYCYAISSDGYISYTNMYVVGDLSDNNSETPSTGDVTTEDNGKYVDLGLTSGTLWATCNLGASTPEEYGDYFAWGETAPKGNYAWSTYKFGGGSNFTKYNSIDGLTELELEDDAAYVILGKSWRMPTHKEELELANECSWESVILNGISGYKIIGPNGNSIFMPRGGLYDGTDYGSDGTKTSSANTGGWYWSATLNSKGSSYAQGLCFYPSLITNVSDHERCDGHNIRPVYVGDINPDNNSDNEFGKVAEIVDLGLSVKWSSWNLGASKVADYGGLYGAGDPTGKLTTTSYMDYHWKDGESICGTEYDLAHVKWGDKWQLPTLEQLNELIEKCTWIHNITIDGITGSKAIGPNGNELFFPYAGCREGSSNSYFNSHCSIWSGETGYAGSVSYSYSYKDLDINFISGTVRLDGCECYRGQSIRPVYVSNDNTPSEYSSEDRLVVKDVTTLSGKTVSVGIELDNKTTDFTAFQFDLTLPEGLELATDDKGKYMVAKTSRYEDDAQSLNISKMGDNRWRFVCFSLSNGTIEETSGAILKAVLAVEDAVETGTYEAVISNVVFTKADGTQLMFNDAKFNIVVSNMLQGDANGDGYVNVSDIVEVVNYILGKASGTFDEAVVDMNGDGIVNVTDVVMMVSIIMSGQYDAARSTMEMAEATTDNDRLTLSENGDSSLSLRLENEGGYVAAQFEVKIDADMALESITMNDHRSGGHQLKYAKTGDNIYKVIVYSVSNTAFGGHNGELLSICTKGSGNVTLDNILFVTDGQKERRFTPLYGNTTGIETIQPSTINRQNSYDLQGRKVENVQLKKGVYILNGKKQVVR